jgi:hypothetical protein
MHGKADACSRLVGVAASVRVRPPPAPLASGLASLANFARSGSSRVVSTSVSWIFSDIENLTRQISVKHSSIYTSLPGPCP